MQHIRVCLAFLIVGGLSCEAAEDTEVSDAWGYHIGQKAVPKVVIQPSAEQFRVYPGHPRLFFRDTDLPVIRDRLQHDFREEWVRLYQYAEETLAKSPADRARRAKAWHSGRAVTFVATVTGESRFRDWALQWAEAMMRIGLPPNESDDHYRGRLMSLAIIYDWLYPVLPEEKRSRIRSSICAHIDRNWYFAEAPNYIGGHSRWGNFSLAAGLLAVVSEEPDLREKLLIVRDHWIKGFHTIQAWIAVDGGYHMGTSYGTAYNLVRNHCVWSSATNEDVYYPYQKQLPFYWIYANPYSTDYPRIGDFYGWDYGRGSTIVAAGVFKSPYAAWWADRNRGEDAFYDILYADPSVKPLAPDAAARPLPLSRHFRNAGYVIMRDRWNDRSTLVYFKSSSFSSENHHHRDQNSFVISYRGRLAIDSGVYQQNWGAGYGSEHWQNYFTRTIAHNSVTIFDPQEPFGTSKYGPRSNDGGQMWLNPRTPENILPGGAAHLDGITAYVDEGVYAFTTGDATKAYNSDKCRQFVRSFLYLRKPAHWDWPVMFVYDRVVSTKPEYVKRWLLHAIERPQVNSTHIEITAGEGKLYLSTLLPQEPRYKIVGGPGNKFLVNGRNYPPAKLDKVDPPECDQKAGAWRIEVVPKQPAMEDRFLHMMTVTDRENKAAPPVPSLITADQLHGAEVDQYVILFNTGDTALESCRYEVTATGVRTHLVLGVAPARAYSLFHKGKEVLTRTSTQAGTVMFQLDQAGIGTYEVQ